MPTTTIPGPGIQQIYDQIQSLIGSFEPERQAAKTAGKSALQGVVDLYSDEGLLAKTYGKQKQLSMGKAMQGLVSSGLSGTTLPSGISAAWDQGPGLELLRAQMEGKAGALTNMANFEAQTSPSAANVGYLATGGLGGLMSGQYGLISQALGQSGGGGYTPLSASRGGGTTTGRSSATTRTGGYSPGSLSRGGGAGYTALSNQYAGLTGGSGGGGVSSNRDAYDKYAKWYASKGQKVGAYQSGFDYTSGLSKLIAEWGA